MRPRGGELAPLLLGIDASKRPARDNLQRSICRTTKLCWVLSAEHTLPDLAQWENFGYSWMDFAPVNLLRELQLGTMILRQIWGISSFDFRATPSITAMPSSKSATASSTITPVWRWRGLSTRRYRRVVWQAHDQAEKLVFPFQTWQNICKCGPSGRMNTHTANAGPKNILTGLSIKSIIPLCREKGWLKDVLIFFNVVFCPRPSQLIFPFWEGRVTIGA